MTPRQVLVALLPVAAVLAVMLILDRDIFTTWVPYTVAVGLAAVSLWTDHRRAKRPPVREPARY